MFRNKKLLYIGIPFNILLWGYIAFRFYKAFNEEEEFLPTEQVTMLPKLAKEDSLGYELKLNYDDPFLKEEIHYRPNAVSVPVMKEKKNVVAAELQRTISLPKTFDIKYLGLIENKTSGAVTGLVSINGKSYLTKKGETIEGVQIKNISVEKLEAKVGKEIISVQK